MCSKQSFNDIEMWLKELKTHANPDIKVFLIGNKIDLADSRKVTPEEAKKFKEDFMLNLYMETSAKTGFNVQNVFIQVAKELYLQHEEIKNRVSRPGTMIMPLPEDNNNNLVKLEIEEEENTKRKKFCCFN